MRTATPNKANRLRLLMLAVLYAFGASTASTAESAKEQARTQKITLNYATCVVRKHHDKAAQAILSNASNTAIVRKISQIIDSECLSDAAGFGVDMRFPDDTYRYALADALVSADFAERGPLSFADRLPLAQPVLVTQEQRTAQLEKAGGDRKRKSLDEDITRQNALAWLLRYGECIVRTDPESSRYWLLTPPDIPEELSRIKSLQPAFASCLGEGTVKFTRVRMRGAVALNYYRLAKATAVPAQSSERGQADARPH